VPANTTFYVTDGQHRVKAIEAALHKKPALAEDSVPVTLVVEPNIQQVHQDFADAAQTKQIPPSLLTLYNTQDELSHLTVEITENVALFNGRIEKVGKTVSKRSSNFYTLNHVRMSVGAILTGDSSSTGPALRDQTAAMLEGPNYSHWRSDIEWYFNELSELIHEWSLVRDSNLGKTTLLDVEEFRAKYVHFTGTGIAVIGAVGHRILKLKDQVARQAAMKKLASIDWERTDGQGGPNRFWEGTILLADGRLITSRYALEAAVRRVLQEVGLGVPTVAAQPQVAVTTP
jgi:DGQHR domain-containing protein